MSAPKPFRVLAIVTAYNEADILRDTIKYLNDQDIDVCILDNMSTDKQNVNEYLLCAYDCSNSNHGVIGGPKDRYDWWSLLKEVEVLSEELKKDYDWIIHHDADERRTSPWLGVNYKEGIRIADQQGYNLINHQVVEFCPTDNTFMAGQSLEESLQYVDPSAQKACNNVQLKAWKCGPYKVDLKSTGGHTARIPNPRVCPDKFILKHYPVRTQEQGTRKIFKERKERYAQTDLQRGWHVQYRGIEKGHVFVKDKGDLVLWRDEDYLKELDTNE